CLHKNARIVHKYATPVNGQRRVAGSGVSREHRLGALGDAVPGLAALKAVDARRTCLAVTPTRCSIESDQGGWERRASRRIDALFTPARSRIARPRARAPAAPARAARDSAAIRRCPRS